MNPAARVFAALAPCQATLKSGRRCPHGRVYRVEALDPRTDGDEIFHCYVCGVHYRAFRRTDDGSYALPITRITHLPTGRTWTYYDGVGFSSAPLEGS